MNFRQLVVLFLSLIVVGCASLPIGVDSGTQKLDLKDKTLLLVTVDISRKEASRFVPIPRSLIIGSVDASGAVKDAKPLALDGDGWISLNDEKTLYAYRFLASEGTTELSGITGQAKAFPLVGNFYVPLGMRVPVSTPSVVYLGRIEAVLRPRADNEYRAGGVIPLIDQSATGMSNGTFDVHIADRSKEDLPLLRSAYPALATVNIETKLVPVVDREFVDMQWREEDVTGVDPYKHSRKALQPSPPPASPQSSNNTDTQAKVTKPKKKQAARTQKD